VAAVQFGLSGLAGDRRTAAEAWACSLIVIDEAHNVCPAEPPDPLVALATDRAIRIAAEGRKFGLYLLS
jgi:DNA helicase HerA-like ATPase